VECLTYVFADLGALYKFIIIVIIVTEVKKYFYHNIVHIRYSLSKCRLNW